MFLAAALPGLAAVLALLFTWREVRVAEQGQLTSRFNDAISNLGSPSLDVRFGGIYALERIMQDSPRDQPRIVSVLSAYVRRHAAVPSSGFAKEPGNAAQALGIRPPTDVAAVTNVLARRAPRHDAGVQVDWSRADLRGLMLTTWDVKDIAKIPSGGEFPRTRAPFGYANLEGADLRHANLSGVDLRHAFAGDANLSGAQLLRADLGNAQLEGADLTGANILDTDLTGADLSDAVLREAVLGATNLPIPVKPSRLAHAKLPDADLAGASLAGCDLTAANLIGADLTGADLTGANLSGADLRGARLAGAVLTRATTDGTRGLPASVAPRPRPHST